MIDHKDLPIGSLNSTNDIVDDFWIEAEKKLTKIASKLYRAIPLKIMHKAKNVIYDIVQLINFALDCISHHLIVGAN